ncbi:MAG TPA: SusC/RagA family TonB-linked outer membrane protein, partial [Sphingobacterium sp.]|nr:SusC/RagA family TonB-linked outer membrane protein [Sphingobacterium sp.]
WRQELFKDYTMNQRANLNVSGGGKVARYYFAGTFNQDNGVLKVDRQNNFNNNIDLKTYLLRSNVNVQLTKTTEAGVRMYGSFDEYTGPLDGGAEMYRKVMRSNPVMFPAYFPKTDQYDYIEHILFGGSEAGSYINPYADMVRGYRNNSRSLMMAQFELSQDFSFLTKGLSFRAMANTNRQSYFSLRRAYDPFYYQPSFYDPKTGALELQVLNERAGSPYPIGKEYLSFDPGSKTIKSMFYLESASNYNRTFREKHGGSGMMVYIMRQGLDANAGDLQQSLPERNLGLSGRFTYNYDSRYFGEFSYGYNGSERFYTNHRFGFFPSGGVAWQVSNEKFWEPMSSVVQLFKLRATYGLVGNDAIGSVTDRFFYLSNVDMENSGRGAVFGTDWNYSQNGVSISRYENLDITWEIAQKANLGVELKLFNKVDIQADFFSEYRRNILMTRAFIPAYMGFAAPIRANVGEASGRGMDMSVDYQHNFSSDFWITARGNFTYATSAYKVNEEPEYAPEIWRSRIGYPLTLRWGYIAERLFVDDAEVANSPTQTFGLTPTRGGDIKYRDVNGDGQITSLDQVPIGNPTRPEIVYGFGFSSGYKNFDLSCFFQGLAQESFWIDPEATSPFIGEKQLLKAYADNHWSESNRNVMALWPRLTTIEHENNTQVSTWFMRDGAFLRLKNAEFGYTIPR